MGKMTFLDKKEDKDLKNKIEELTGTMDQITLVTWATDCAEHVLSHFEEEYPEDNRPRKAIEAGRAWVHGKVSVSEARFAAFAAHAAARDADEGSVAVAVARAAGHAAATVHVAGHAVHAANYAATSISKERTWQYQHLLDLKGNS
ncbi:putative immunity protein [Clostridium sp.]|uniref:putative immunity protein n=1 Tax=Clostridium sp. TaxID=1506 RepID=UPI003D6CD260